MKAGDKVVFITDGGFTWREPRELFYGIITEQGYVTIYRRDNDSRAYPLGFDEPIEGWCFYNREIAPI